MALDIGVLGGLGLWGTFELRCLGARCVDGMINGELVGICHR